MKQLHCVVRGTFPEWNILIRIPDFFKTLAYPRHVTITLSAKRVHRDQLNTASKTETHPLVRFQYLFR